MLKLPILRRMGASTEATRRRAQDSPNYRDGQFRSHEPTSAGPTPDVSGGGSPAMEAFRERDRGRPVGVVPLSRPEFPAKASDLAITWLGHASSLLEIDAHRFLLDPVFGPRASPSLQVGPKRIHPAPVPVALLPRLDAVVISHDHYDHLDEPTIVELEKIHRPRYIVPIGVDLHLESWGVAPDRITALDWRESTTVGDITLTCTEARHFSGRGFVRNQTLFAGWAFTGPSHKAFFSGDTGPTNRYVNIGDDLGPFDLTLIAIGAYSDFWPDIHLNPEEGIAGHLDLNQVSGGNRESDGPAPRRDSVMLPIHWGTFNLAMHWWSEPIRRARRAASEKGVTLVAPQVGARIDLADDPSGAAGEHQSDWWGAVAADADRD